jgi:hypothetical protein
MQKYNLQFYGKGIIMGTLGGVAYKLRTSELKCKKEDILWHRLQKAL